MKKFTVTPKYRKSVIELNTWEKDVNGRIYVATQEITWRTGEFTLQIPETDEEISEVAQYVANVGRERGYYKTVPSEDIENFNNDEYWFEMEWTNDAVTEEWTVEVRDNAPNDDDRRIILRTEQGIKEEGDEYLYEDEWEQDLNDFTILGGIKLTPC